jgi:hypothetical protein
VAIWHSRLTFSVMSPGDEVEGDDVKLSEVVKEAEKEDIEDDDAGVERRVIDDVAISGQPVFEFEVGFSEDEGGGDVCSRASAPTNTPRYF